MVIRGANPPGSPICSVARSGVASPLSATATKNRQRLIEINKSAAKPVEYYRGWNDDL